MGRKKKPKPKASQPINSKLIVPGAETGRKSQLLVPGDAVGKASTKLSIPGVEQPVESAQPTPMSEDIPPPDQMTVINEDTGESVTEDSQPVKVTAMVPPPEPLAEVEDVPPIDDGPIEPVEMVAPSESEEPVVAAEEWEQADSEAEVEYAVEEEPVYEGYADPSGEYADQDGAYADQAGHYADQVEEYADQVEEYADPAEGWEQPAEQAYYDPAQYAPAPVPAPLPPPSLAPPQPVPPMPHAQPPYGYGPPPGYGPPQGYGPPPGYRTQGMMPGQMYPNAFAPARNVPSWALILVGILVGFLGAMVIFKFTGMGAALRGDLIEEGRQKAKSEYERELDRRRADGYDEGEPEVEKKPTDGEGAEEGDSDPATGSEVDDGGAGAELESGDAGGAEPDDGGAPDADPDDSADPDAGASGAAGTTEVEFNADIPDSSEGEEPDE